MEALCVDLGLDWSYVWGQGQGASGPGLRFKTGVYHDHQIYS